MYDIITYRKLFSLILVVKIFSEMYYEKSNLAIPTQCVQKIENGKTSGYIIKHVVPCRHTYKDSIRNVLIYYLL